MSRLLWWTGLIALLATAVSSHFDLLGLPIEWKGRVEFVSAALALVMAYLRNPKPDPSQYVRRPPSAS